MIKMFYRRMFIVCSILSLFLMNSCKNLEKKVTLLMSECNPQETISGMMDKKFCEEVARLSGGSITIDLRCTGILGDQQTIVDEIFDGQKGVDILRCAISDISDKGCNKARILSIPFLFPTRESYWDFVDSELSNEILNEPKSKNYPVLGLFWGDEGFRHFFSVSTLKTMKDMEGRRVRISTDPVMCSFIKEIGANPINTAFSELYGALRVESVEIAEQPLSNYYSNYFYEVAPNVILDGHTLGITLTIISERAWNSLSKKQKEIITEAGKIASQYCRNISEARDNKVIMDLRGKGVTITEITNKKEWEDAVNKTISSNSSIDYDFYQKVKAFQK